MAKTFKVTRRCIVNITSDLIQCSSPITAIITADNHNDYETAVRQLSRDGIITNIEFEELAGAVVEEISPDQQFYDFEEEDLEEIKNAFGMN